VEDIKRLHEEKINLTKRLELVQLEMENHSCVNGVSDDSNHEIISRLEKENKELHEELNKYIKNSGVCLLKSTAQTHNIKSSGVCLLNSTAQIHNIKSSGVCLLTSTP
jgi:hypothetical protein